MGQRDRSALQIAVFGAISYALMSLIRLAIRLIVASVRFLFFTKSGWIMIAALVVLAGIGQLVQMISG